VKKRARYSVNNLAEQMVEMSVSTKVETTAVETVMLLVVSSDILKVELSADLKVYFAVGPTEKCLADEMVVKLA
jgi:hypothetical protein